MTMAKQANASLAALGGFVETIKPGCEVEVGDIGASYTRETNTEQIMTWTDKDANASLAAVGGSMQTIKPG